MPVYAVLLAALCGLAGAAVNVEPPSLNPTIDSCVPMLPLQDLDNVTYECEAMNGTILWQLGDYQLVDRDEFQTNGVLTLANMGNASLTIFPKGVMFLFGQLQMDTVEVTCLAVVDDVNLGAAPSVIVYADFTPDLPSPEHDVTKCDDDGSYTVDISYQRLSSDENCTQIINYTISISGEEVLTVSGNDDVDLSVSVNVEDTAGYTATLEVCTEMVCRAVATSLTGLTCTRPTWGNCDGQATLSCNFIAETSSDWSCAFTTNEAGDIAVVDVFPDGRRGGQSRVPSFDQDFNCPEEKDNIGLIIGLAVAVVVAVLAVGIAVGVAIYHCITRGKKNGSDNIPLKSPK